MPGTYPSHIAPASVAETSNPRTEVSYTHSHKRQARKLGGQWFGFAFSYPTLTLAEARVFQGFAAAQDGRAGTFTLVVPRLSYRSGGSGNGTVATTTASGRTVPGTGFPVSTLIARAGDFVKFSGHSKVYRLTADVSANGSGSASFAFSPALFASVASGETIILDAVPFTVSFTKDDTKMDFTPGIFGAYAPEFEEVLG